MQKISLTSEEKLQLKNRGFLLKSNHDYIGFIKTTFYYIILIGPLFLVSLTFEQVISSNMYFLTSLAILFLLHLSFTYTFLFSTNLFYSDQVIVGYGEELKGTHEIKRKKDKITLLGDISKKILAFFYSFGTFLDAFFIKKGLGLLFFLGWIFLSISGWVFLGMYLINNIQILYILLFSYGLLSSSIVIFSRLLNPLYAFGNLGQKIQSLTPRISEQSKQIESEFRGDMDFRVLSKSFDSLASTFSQIVNLVVKLEKVEHKANKGDLFDSTKYIDSLRTDIRNPLSGLKKFLEKKRKELQVSQEELMRVLVSVGGESENRELQSIRGTELMKELDENIGKLDVMLEKI